MKILVVGSGGREHAICLAFSRSPRVSKLYCASGNAGIAQIAECVPIKHDEIERLADFAAENLIDLTFVGGENPLALGIVDEFEKRGFKIIGASKAAARLEASKAFSKDFMTRHGVPTAKYFVADSIGQAQFVLIDGDFGDQHTPVVVKADGLAAGKGVVVAKNRDEALQALSDLENIAGVEATKKIVVEEHLRGPEVSLILFADGEDFALMPPTRDHKRIGEGDTGPNTGGMGTITDDTLLSETQMQQIINEMIKPTLKGCIEEGFPFCGILFLGLMMTPGGNASVNERAGQETGTPERTAKLLEYNVRFGDPETQSILVRLETDLVDICEAMLAGRLGELDIEWTPGNSATVVLAAKGYPHNPQKGDLISGLDEATKIEHVTIFHAGTQAEPPAVAGGLSQPVTNYVTSGGRVLGITAVGQSIDEVLSKSYKAVSKISWDGMQFRHDIGK